MSVALQFKLTTTGSAACWNASNTGLSLNLTHIQLGSGNRAPTGTEKALVTPQQAVPIAAGFSVSNTQIRMSSIFSGSTSFVIREVGLWAGDPSVGGSKLIGYWSQASGDLAVKSSGVDFVFSHDMIIDGSVPAGSLTIQADGAQSAMLAMMMAHEAKPDPHPQYLNQTDYQTQAHSAFTTAGTAPIFTGAMTPAPASLTAGLRGRAKFHSSTTSAATLNLNSLGAKSLKQYDSSGNKVPAVIMANVLTDVEYDGTDWVLIDQLPISAAATTAGTAPTYTAPLIPAPSSMTATFNVLLTIHASNSGAASTLNVNGLGAKSIKQYDSSGAKINAVLVAGQKTFVTYDGTDWVVLNALPVLGSTFRQITNVTQTGFTANTTYATGLTITVPRTGRMFVHAKAVFQPRGNSDMCSYVTVNGVIGAGDLRGGAASMTGWESPQAFDIIDVVAGDVISSAVQSNGGGTVITRSLMASYIERL